MSRERLDELSQIATTYNININLLTESKSLPDRTELKEFFNAEKPAELSSTSDFTYMIKSYNEFLLKIKLAILSNCGFVNYDVEANNQLSKLLEKMEALNFNIE
jgi:hypothetical protein